MNIVYRTPCQYLPALLVLLFLTLLTGCANTQLASKEEDALAKQFSPPADRSYIYIIRESAIRGQAIHLSISIDRGVVGAIQNKTYALVDVKPGKHIVEVGNSVNGKGPNLDFLHPLRINLETLPGRSYFIAGHLTMGTPDIKVIPESQGRSLIVDKNFKRVKTLF